MPPSTPIEAWPRVRGQSRRAFLVSAAEDPLSVADRIGSAMIERNVRAAETPDEVTARVELVRRLAEENWKRLCVSFDHVIATLRSEPRTPALRKLIREAERAKRAA